MKNLIIGIAVGGVLAAGGVLGFQQLFSNETKPVVIPSGPVGPGGTKAATSGVIDLICELHLDIEGQLALGIQGNEPPRITMAQVDMDKSSGWYQGKLSISESRAGVLSVRNSEPFEFSPSLLNEMIPRLVWRRFNDSSGILLPSKPALSSLALPPVRTIPGKPPVKAAPR